MRKEISLLIFSNTASAIGQITLSRPIAWLFVLILSVCLSVAGYAAFDYVRIKKAMPHSSYLETKIAGHLDTIEDQRKHIQALAGEVNVLKSKLVSLNQFEEKIRVIANIKKTPGQESLFGVGGTIPEDIDTTVALTTDHSSLIRDMHTQTEQLELASASQERGFGSLIRRLQDQQNLLASTPAIRPTDGWVTSGFGYRTSPFTGQRVFHKAVDIATREGTPVVATADGVITFTGSKGLLGKIIAIDHGYGMITRYAHLNKILKNLGAAVKRGDRIGLVGMTGRTTGPHLHYEVHLNGIPVNPKRYILN